MSSDFDISSPVLRTLAKIQYSFHKAALQMWNQDSGLMRTFQSLSVSTPGCAIMRGQPLGGVSKADWMVGITAFHSGIRIKPYCGVCHSLIFPSCRHAFIMIYNTDVNMVQTCIPTRNLQLRTEIGHRKPDSSTRFSTRESRKLKAAEASIIPSAEPAGCKNNMSSWKTRSHWRKLACQYSRISTWRCRAAPILAERASSCSCKLQGKSQDDFEGPKLSITPLHKSKIQVELGSEDAVSDLAVENCLRRSFQKLFAWNVSSSSVQAGLDFEFWFSYWTWPGSGASRPQD